ncbi:MAG: AraC family transcriptional regulator [Proteobacteria bacterium]|nr:AraC family transcriptional regulator [Pseudomonadota bacterium]MBS0494385.1 AraC family transcriptional regulator [Pseudomonadota bacterium]
MNEDLLSEVLRSVRLRGVLYFHVSGSRDWAAEAPPSREIAAAVMPGSDHVIEFHAVISGACWGSVVGERPVRLEAGDIILFPQGDAHVISSAPGMRAPPNPEGYFERKGQRQPFILHLDAREVHMGDPPGGPCDTTLVCGFFGCDTRPFNPLITSLPHVMHLRSSSTQDWTVQCMRQAVTEALTTRPGSTAVLERLSEMLFIDAMRQYLGTLPEGSSGWLAGLRDRFVGPALALMHAAPAQSWTVDELGRRVGLSRSAFHARFVNMIGQTPMQYLTHWRMQAGAALLRDTAATVVAIAQDVGYESEASFSRAFKRFMGKPPALWRRATGG